MRESESIGQPKDYDVDGNVHEQREPLTGELLDELWAKMTIWEKLKWLFT